MWEALIQFVSLIVGAIGDYYYYKSKTFWRWIILSLVLIIIFAYFVV